MFNPQDWYWFVAGDTTKAYSSKRNTYVDPATDSAYATWAQVNHPIPAQTEADIWYYVQPFLPAWVWNGTTMSQPTATTYTKAQLAGYSATARYNRASGGVTITGKPYLSDPTSRNTISSAHDYAVANPGHVTDWKLADGTFIQLTAAQLANSLQQMATFVQSCFTCESTTLASINSGSITTLAAIDSAYAAVTNVYP